MAPWRAQVSVSPTRSAVTSLTPVIRYPHLPGPELPGRGHLGVEEADVIDLSVGLGLHREDRIALGEGAVDHADIGDHAAVLVELGIEDQRPRGRGRVARGRRHPCDQLVEHIGDALTGLRADPAHQRGILADQVGDLLGDALGLGAGQVELVHAGDQFQPGVDRQVGVRDRLCLHALAGVDHQQSSLACGEGARDLVSEVHVARGVDQVQLIGLAVELRGVEDPHRAGLDRDPALALEVHRVEQLGAHRPRVDGMGQLEDPICQRRLAMVDVGDDREVADVRLVGDGSVS